MSMTSSSSPFVITVRLIRSFEHRNIKHVVYKDITQDTTVKEFIAFVKSDIKMRQGIPPPFRNHDYDTLKIQHQAFGAKTSDPAINTENDNQLVLSNDATLASSNVVHETELSFYKLEDYVKYKANPITAW